MKKQVVVLALIVAAVAAVLGSATILETIQADAKNGTGCAVNSTGFKHSHGKCFHPENLLKHKGNETD